MQLKCTKLDFGWGSAPDPAGGAYSAPPDPLAGLRGPTSKGRAGKGKERKGRGPTSKGRGGEGTGGERGRGEGKEEGDGRNNPKPAATGLYKPQISSLAPHLQ